jgi:putative ABC transport system permease protein
MLKNFLKISYRNFVKQKSYSLINIFGLTLGLACYILILVHIGYELSYDSYHRNAGRIYRIASQRVSMGTTNEFATVPAPTGPTMVEDFPEVIGAVRFSPTVKRAFSYGDKKFFQENVFYADRSVFEVFSFDLIEGDPKTALEAPFTMVVTEKAARKYFGSEDSLGKFVNWDNKFDYRVTGVVKDPPPNSHFTFEVLASLSTFFEYDPRIGEWRGGSFATYIEFAEDADIHEFEQKLEDFAARYIEPIFRDTGVTMGLFIQPLKSIHLRSRLQGELGASGDIRMIYAFAAIAVVILLVASVNFMNLATARSANRAREVGMRKILGAERSKLVLQFLGESYVLCFFAFGIALGAARLLLPYFGGLLGRNIPADFLRTPSIVGGLAGVFIFVGLAAGSYPALFLSAFKPISIIGGNLSRGPKGSRFRSALVVFQFTVMAILIIGTIVIFKQLNYMQSKDLGFEKENLLVLAINNDDVRRGLDAYKTEVLRMPEVVSAGASSMVPGEMYLFNLATFPEGLPRELALRMDNFLVDDGFVRTFGIEVIKGRAFSREIASDRKEAVMINETAARKLQWDDPIGKTIEIRAAFSDDIIKKKVIGVFRDIHQRSLYAVIQPTIVEYIGTEGPIENRARRLTLRLETEDLPETIASIERKWKEMFPDHPFYSFFLDDFYAAQHTAEARLGGIFRLFSLAAVLIACVGLFGLASFESEQRAKEIGIRKVLGSSSAAIVALLFKEFVLLIAVANVLAGPMAFLAARKWLQNFPYGVRVGLSTFILTAMLTLAVAFVSVGYRSVKAARANPADLLRYE